MIEGWGSTEFQDIAIVREGLCFGKGGSMEVVYDSMAPGEKLDLLLHLVLGKGQV